jgi:hypothetical protein
MWLFTKHGFYSAVCARTGDGRQGQPPDPNRIMVRARVREHLNGLKDRFPDLLGHCEIKESVGTDYAFRIFVEKQAWSHMVKSLVDDIDYDNFKSEVARHQGSSGAAYEHSLHAVWSIMYRLQDGS